MNLFSSEPLINSFRDEYAFLSNFYPAEFRFYGLEWPTAEHAYQAGKASSTAQFEQFRLPTLTAGGAKRLGASVWKTLSEDEKSEWLNHRVDHMIQVVRAKFYPGSHMAKLLLDTGYSTLIEGNEWGDTFWGMCGGKGENFLGRILESHRESLRR